MRVVLRRVIHSIIVFTGLWGLVLLFFLGAQASDTRTYFIEKLTIIKPGMTRAQAEEVMKDFEKGTKWPYSSERSLRVIGSRKGTYAIDLARTEELTLKDCDVFRHSNDPKFDSDWGIVCFNGDVVAWVDFAPD